MSDLVVSLLRTAVPTAWGVLITWLLTVVTWLPSLLDTLGVDPLSAEVRSAVTGLVLVGWYALWRKLEPVVPAWLVTIVLGMAKAPTYSTPTLADGRTIDEANADLAAADADRDVPFTQPL